MLKRWDNKKDEEEQLKQEITQASTRATELAKRVDDLSSYRQEMKIIAENQSKYNQDVNKIKEDITQQLSQISITQQTQCRKLQDQIDDVNLDVKKIKGTINDIIDYLNNRK